MRHVTFAMLALPVLCAGGLLAACATPQEHAAQRAFDDLPQPSALANLSSGDPSASEATPRLADFPALVREAATRSPALRAAWYDARSATVGIAGARRLPDPRVSLTTFILPVETRVGPQRFQVGASQAFPWPSKLARAADAASSRATVARAAFELEYERLVLALRVPWVALARTVAAADLTRAQAAVVAEVRGLAELRSATGTKHADYGAIARLAMRQEELLEQARTLDDAAATLRDQIRLLAHLPGDTALPAPSLPEPPAATPPEVATASPLVAVARVQRDAAEARRELADTQGLPDFDIGAMWTYVGDARMPGVSDSGQDVVALTVGVRIPLWGSAYDADEAAAAAAVEAASARIVALEDQAQSQVLTLSQQLETARRKVALYEGRLETAAKSALTFALDAYGTGEGDLEAVFRIEAQLIDYRLAAVEARASALDASAKLAFYLASDKAVSR